MERCQRVYSVVLYMSPAASLTANLLYHRGTIFIVNRFTKIAITATYVLNLYLSCCCLLHGFGNAQSSFSLCKLFQLEQFQNPLLSFYCPLFPIIFQQQLICLLSTQAFFVCLQDVIQLKLYNNFKEILFRSASSLL